ncbi:TetR family transcriptional regulator [Nocardia sp. CA-290969]|uniref:TetR family transcriptional regulator n=1 Tax=Nocardia sp. CA-290969 TaxID=3239986 RepID=UPI003D8A2DB5
MPRIAEVRDAAAPSSTEQRARVGRILTAAAELASVHEFERVQMGEVAKSAGVAVATLYRYFPSKTHLFVAVMLDQIDRMREKFARAAGSESDPKDAVHAALVRVVRVLLRRPLLSAAMIQSNSTAKVSAVPDTARVDRAFRQLLCTAAGIDRMTERDAARLRLLIHAVFGIIQSCLNGRIAIADAESDLRDLCDLLLVDWPELSPETD